MNEGRRTPSMAVWTTAVLLAVLAYPLAFGPSVWLASRRHLDRKAVGWVFSPIMQAAVRAPEPVKEITRWWAEIGIPSDSTVWFNVPEDGGEIPVFFGRPPIGFGIGPVVGRHLGEVHASGSP